MTQHPSIESEKRDTLVYEPVPTEQTPVSILAPLLVEVLNQFRFTKATSDLPIIA